MLFFELLYALGFITLINDHRQSFNFKHTVPCLVVADSIIVFTLQDVGRLQRCENPWTGFSSLLTIDPIAHERYILFVRFQAGLCSNAAGV